MRVLILGHGEHGKGEASKILADEFGLSHISSSVAASEKVVFPVMAVTHGYKTALECFNDRRKYRDVWRCLITNYNLIDKARLVREVLETFDIYDGLRCKYEFEASKNLFDLILYIDASERKPKDSTMNIEYDPARMVLIDNNGPIESMRAQLSEVYWRRMAG